MECICDTQLEGQSLFKTSETQRHCSMFVVYATNGMRYPSRRPYSVAGYINGDRPSIHERDQSSSILNFFDLRLVKMVHLNKFLQLLAFPLFLSLLGAEATLPSRFGSYLQSRAVKGAVPPVLDVKPFLEPRNDHDHMLHALDLVRRLVDDQGSMVEVSEQDLQSLLDQINSLQAQVNGLLPIPPTSTLPDQQSTTQPGDDPGNQISELPLSTTLSENLPTTTEPLQPEESASGQPEDVSDDQSVDSSDGQSGDESVVQSDETSAGSATATSEESSQVSTDLPEEPSSSVAISTTTTTVSVPGGRFKETPRTRTLRSSRTTTSRQPVDTQEPSSEEQQEDSAGATDLVCPIAGFSVVDGTTISVSELFPSTLNTNCITGTVSTPESAATTSSIAPALTTSALLAETAQLSETTAPTDTPATTQEASVQTTSTSSAVSLIASASMQGDDDATDIPPELRTLVFTSVLMRMSTVTLTSMHTEFFTVTESGAAASSTVSEVDDVEESSENEVDSQGDATIGKSEAQFIESGPGTDKSAENVAIVTSESLSSSTGQGLPTNSTASILPTTSEIVSASSSSITLSDVSTMETETFPTMSSVANSTSSISYLSSFTTMLKPTTSVRETA